MFKTILQRIKGSKTKDPPLTLGPKLVHNIGPQYIEIPKRMRGKSQNFKLVVGHKKCDERKEGVYSEHNEASSSMCEYLNV